MAASAEVAAAAAVLALPPAIPTESHQAAMRRHGMTIVLFVASPLLLLCTTTTTTAPVAQKVRLLVFYVCLMLGLALLLFSPMPRRIGGAVQHLTAAVAALRTVGQANVDRREATMLRRTGFHVLLTVVPTLLLAVVTAAAGADKLRVAWLFAAMMVGVCLIVLSVVRYLIPQAVLREAVAMAEQLNGALFGGHIAESDET